MSSKTHALSTERMSGAAQCAILDRLPEAATQVTSDVTVSRAFHLEVSEMISLSCRCVVRMHGQVWEERPVAEVAPEISQADLDVHISDPRFDYDIVELFVPEWSAEVSGEEICSRDLTERLANGEPCVAARFPSDQRDMYNHSGGSLKDLFARHARGIDWALDRVRDGRVALDLDGIRLRVAGSVYDGHGTLLATMMVLRPDDMKRFMETHGEEALRTAFREGHILLASAEGRNRVSERVADATCAKLAGRREGHIGLRPVVTWDRDVFESLVRPALDPGAFPGDGSDGELARAFLARRMGLEAGPGPGDPA